MKIIVAITINEQRDAAQSQMMDTFIEPSHTKGDARRESGDSAKNRRGALARQAHTRDR
jgi:hypothetical protein